MSKLFLFSVLALAQFLPSTTFIPCQFCIIFLDSRLLVVNVAGPYPQGTDVLKRHINSNLKMHSNVKNAKNKAKQEASEGMNLTD